MAPVSFCFVCGGGYGRGRVDMRRRVCTKMSAGPTCPSSAVLEKLLSERRLKVRASSCHVSDSSHDEGSDSRFVLAREGFAGVADTGIINASKVYGETLARRVRFENRTLLDDVVRHVLFDRPDSRWTSIATYVEHALSQLSFPESASTCIVSLEDQKLRAAWVGSAVPSAIERLESSLEAELEAEHSPLRPKTSVLDVQDGDLVIIATDGLWDNVTEAQIKAYLRPTIVDGFGSRQDDDPQRQCSLLAHLGAAFADMEEGDNFLSDRFVSGATHDDVSVIVMSITKDIV